MMHPFLSIRSFLRPALLGLVAMSLFSYAPRPVSAPTDEPPEANRFTKTVLAETLGEPMEMTFLPDGRILFIERKGALKAWYQTGIGVGDDSGQY
ncbi:MAG: PQQ-dependent sugar dehydrogenase [Cytophagaceae bacterium]|nr:PQQ-dependent sugar dehydrogenase [Cytophagaceae bacterium]